MEKSNGLGALNTELMDEPEQLSVKSDEGSESGTDWGVDVSLTQNQGIKNMLATAGVPLTNTTPEAVRAALDEAARETEAVDQTWETEAA